MKKFIVFLIVILSIGTILSGCVGGEQGKVTEQELIKQEIVVNAGTEPPAMDPALSTDTTSGWILDHIFEGLYTRDKDGKPALGVAKNVELSDDGKRYTFTLRDDAKWSDGSLVTANDFEYAWKRVLKPETGSSFAYYLYYIKGAEEYNKGIGTVEEVGIKAIDEHTLVVELNAPLGYFDSLLTLMTFYPVKKDLVEGNKNWSADAETYVSNGPFKMTKWEHDSKLVIEKNSEYFAKDVINLDKVTFKMVEDATTAYQMFKTKELDLNIGIPTDVIDSESKNKEFLQVPYYGTYMFQFNVEKEPFNNPKVRQAFAMAIDRETIIKNVTKAGTPAYSMVPPGADTNEGDFRKVGGDFIEENYEKAKKLLAEGMSEEGWATLPEITLIYNTAESHKKIAEVIQEMLKVNLGVNINLSNQEWGTYLETIRQQNYQMARMGWTGAFVDPVANLNYFLDVNNDTGWTNKEFELIIEKSKVEQDQDKRYELLHDAEKILMTDLPFIPVYYYASNYLVSQNFNDIAFYVNSNPSFKWAKKVSE